MTLLLCCTLANEKENEDFVQPSTSKRPRSRGGDSESTYAESENFSIHNSSDEGTLAEFLEGSVDPEPEKKIFFQDFFSVPELDQIWGFLKYFIGATSYNVYFCKRLLLNFRC